MLNFFMLSVIVLNDLMLSVVASFPLLALEAGLEPSILRL
jgi:hypothetical protein